MKLFSSKRGSFNFKEIVIVFLVIVIVGGFLSYFSVNLNGLQTHELPAEANLYVPQDSDVFSNNDNEFGYNAVIRVGEFRDELIAY